MEGGFLAAAPGAGFAKVAASVAGRAIISGTAKSLGNVLLGGNADQLNPTTILTDAVIAGVTAGTASGIISVFKGGSFLFGAGHGVGGDLTIGGVLDDAGNEVASEMAGTTFKAANSNSIIKAVPEATQAWTSASVRKAANELSEGATDIIVTNRQQAEELLNGLYTGKGLKNTTGWNPMEAKDWFRNGGHYHWDDVFDETGRLLGHGASNPHGTIPHLQIHDTGNKIIRIFFR